MPIVDLITGQKKILVVEDNRHQLKALSELKRGDTASLERKMGGKRWTSSKVVLSFLLSCLTSRCQ
jgi:hypothetical protein